MDAALREFVAKGFAGARVDRIAQRAGVNKRMLYHYFGSKEGLFQAILALRLVEWAAWQRETPEDPGERLEYWFGRMSRDTDWVRLAQWEALHGGSTIGEAERRALFGRAVEQLRGLQGRGKIAGDLDPREVLLCMMALTTFPLAFPQMTRLVTGLAPGDRAFRARHTRFLRRVADAFRPRRPR